MADGIEALNGCNLKTEIFQKFNIETEVANNMNILVSGFRRNWEIFHVFILVKMDLEAVVLLMESQ